jgi:cytoskeletal protein CcmA (bactofilin family)
LKEETPKQSIIRRLGNMRFKSAEITVISEKTSLEGKLGTPGTLNLMGSFEGDLKAGTCEIFKDGKAVGSVEAENITVAGHFEGEIICHNLLAIAKTAGVKGRVAYGTLTVEPGGLLEAEVFQFESADAKLLTFNSSKIHSEEK